MRWTYLVTWVVVSPVGRISDEASSRMQKAPLVFNNLRRLWRRPSLIKGLVCTSGIRSVLI